MMFTTLRLLLWKDLRQHRAVLIGSLVLLALPFGFFAVQASNSDEWASPLEVVFIAGLTAMYLAIFSSATVGGTAFASERATGAADTLQLLVPRRGVRLLASGLFALVGIASGFGLAAIATVASWASGANDGAMSREDLRTMVLVAGSVNLAACATAWAASTVLRSQTISVALGVGAAGVIAFVPLSERIFGRDGSGVGLAGQILWLESTLAVAALVLGSVLYLRRTEP